MNYTSVYAGVYSVNVDTEGITDVAEIIKAELITEPPLVLQVVSDAADDHGPAVCAYVLGSVDVSTGMPGRHAVHALRATVPEGILLPPDEAERENFSDEQQVALHALLTWQCENGLLIPEDVN
jgi:hypothetical protein